MVLFVTETATVWPSVLTAVTATVPALMRCWKKVKYSVER